MNVSWYLIGYASGFASFLIPAGVMTWQVMHNPHKIIRYVMRAMNSDKPKKAA